MWWERYGVKPVRPDTAGRKKWFGAELTLKSLPHLEKTVKVASEKGAVGWWVTPWLQTERGSQATITVYFPKQGQAKAFSSSPPPAPRSRSAAH
jgi:hypothetical protein